VGRMLIKCEAKNTEKEKRRNIIQYIRNVSEEYSMQVKDYNRKGKLAELNRLKQIKK
jgi:hypothetical protein